MYEKIFVAGYIALALRNNQQYMDNVEQIKNQKSSIETYRRPRRLASAPSTRTKTLRRQGETCRRLGR